jgi:FAD/FMN-containing dehydrogenase
MCVRAPDLVIGATQSRDAPVPILVWMGRVNDVTGVANWAGNQRWSPQAVVEPRDENHVVDVVCRAAEDRVRLKVIGGAHSWSDAAVTDGMMVRLDRLGGVVGVGDESVTVEAGMRLGRLVSFLDERGLALPVLPTITEQTVVGAVATATHGSSLHHGSLSSLVAHVRLVTAAGEVADVGPGEGHLDAARVHLGALGVATQVTLAVVPQFWLLETMTPVPLDDVAGSLPDVAASAEYVKVWWFPHSERCTVLRHDHTTDRREVSAAARRVERSLNRFVFPALLGAGRRWPSLIPRISRRVGAVYARSQSRIGRSQEVSTVAMPPVNGQIEYSLPVEQAPEAFTALSRLIRDEQLHVDFPAEIRFGPAETAWMSPSHRRVSVHIGAYMAHGPDSGRYFAGFERAMLDLGGRPHPGKEHGLVPADLLTRFDKGTNFRDLAFDLDPHGMFANPFLDRWLGART